jgi:type I restriction enzyme S subunit
VTNEQQMNHSHFLERLLDGAEVGWKSLGEITKKISSGKNKDKSEIGNYPVYGSTGIIGKTNNKVYDEEQILVARVGANAGRVNIAQGEYDVSDNTLIIQPIENTNLKFLYYYLVNINLNRFTKGAGQPLLTSG